MGSKSRMAQEKVMEEYKATHPNELARQREEMPWLWSMLTEWTFPISTKVVHVSSRKSVNRVIDSGTWQKWCFHFEDREGRGERLTLRDWSGDKVQSTLREGIEFSGVLLHIKKEERLADVAVLTHLNYGHTAKFEIFRCDIQGGFGLILPELLMKHVD
ncbi:MAG: hypothetical protein WAW81_00780 [Minisyncoccia bacterium]